MQKSCANGCANGCANFVPMIIEKGKKVPIWCHFRGENFGRCANQIKVSDHKIGGYKKSQE